MKKLWRYALAFLMLPPALGCSQVNPKVSQTVRLFHLEQDLNALHELQAARGQGPTTLEELALRQQLCEKLSAAGLDVDSVIAELSNEQSDLGTIRTELQAKQAKKVGRLTTAALLTGSAIGAGVSATQFTTLGGRTQNFGDGVGIGSGVVSTILSVLAAKAQNGPTGSVGRTPNMLAPLLGHVEPALHTEYPSEVLAFLNSVPADEAPDAGTRLEQLMVDWGKAGRLGHRAALTTSGDGVRVSIADLSNRIAMLGDVRGRVALIKRDLANLIRSTLTPGTDVAP